MDHNILTAANEKECYTVALYVTNDIPGVKRRKNSSDYPLMMKVDVVIAGANF